jgi:Ser/Thr protein kinase RdoA (MazF antagonist)
VEPHPFQQRISYSDSLEGLLQLVISAYSFGTYASHRVMEVGYEDLNVALYTETGSYLVKFFSSSRTDSDCKRYVDTMRIAVENGINHPKLYRSDSGHLTVLQQNGNAIRLAVIEYVEGKTFFDLNRKPTSDEKQFIIQQAATIHRIDYHPEFVYDSWATCNFLQEYAKTRQHLEESQVELLDALAVEFEKIPLNDLPHCFVHGDIIDPNVMKSDSGEIFILDFSVSNYYPRIQELGVLLTDILFDTKEEELFLKSVESAVAMYRQYNTLTDDEVKALPYFIKAGHAMHILGATQTILDSGGGVENDHWLRSGIEGLEFTSKVFDT